MALTGTHPAGKRKEIESEKPETPTVPFSPGACPLPEPVQELARQLPFLPQIGEVIGHYRVLREIGRGGMSMVYQAWDQELLRNVALKVLLPEYAGLPGSDQQILMEARAAASITHDNVVSIYHVGSDHGRPFLAMPYLNGTSLSAYMAKRGCPKLEPLQIARIGREIASGLAAAHEMGIVHSDVKPSNIWLEAPRGRVKLLDFGIARMARPEQPGHLEAAGFVGTPEYASPEQVRLEPLAPRSDLFSLGCVLFELIVGKPPFARKSREETLSAVIYDPLPPLEIGEQTLPRELIEVVESLLRKAPDLRPSSALVVAERLKHLERELIAARRKDGQTSSEQRLPSVDAAYGEGVPLAAETVHEPLSSATNRHSGEEAPPRRVRQWNWLIWAMLLSALLVAAALAWAIMQR